MYKILTTWSGIFNSDICVCETLLKTFMTATRIGTAIAATQLLHFGIGAVPPFVALCQQQRQGYHAISYPAMLHVFVVDMFLLQKLISNACCLDQYTLMLMNVHCITLWIYNTLCVWLEDAPYVSDLGGGWTAS